MVGATGIEPVAPAMSTRCSTAELRAQDRRPERRLLKAGLIACTPWECKACGKLTTGAALCRAPRHSDWGSVSGCHQSQRSCDRVKAGHMTASDHRAVASRFALGCCTHGEADPRAGAERQGAGGVRRCGRSRAANYSNSTLTPECGMSVAFRQGPRGLWETALALRSILSRPDGWPARSPADASPPASRPVGARSPGCGSAPCAGAVSATRPRGRRSIGSPTAGCPHRASFIPGRGNASPSNSQGGAGFGNAARPVLCGGHIAMRVPTAIPHNCDNCPTPTEFT